MDWTKAHIEGAFYIAAIAIWGFYEYREREIRHRKAILDLQKNIQPKIGNPPTWNKVGTMTATAALLLLVIVSGVFFVSKFGFYDGSLIIVVLIQLTLVDLLLFMMVIRDTKTLRKA